MKVERSAFPRTGTLVQVIKFLTEIPQDRTTCVYVGPVSGKPGEFNFALFPAEVSASKEQAEILAALDAVTRAANGMSQATSTSNGRTESFGK